MPIWTPTREWLGQDAIIIGGGSSLRDFDFGVLCGLNVIGCNAAFKLGPKIVKVCLFGDSAWFQRNKWELEKFSGRVVSCAPTTEHFKLPWLHWMRRVRDGLHSGSSLGWNYSTGAAAINLAISLGASRIYLLGYDLSGGEGGRTHWHSDYAKKTLDASFQRFQRGFLRLSADINKRKDVSVFNVTDGQSKLPCFERIGLEEFKAAILPKEVAA